MKKKRSKKIKAAYLNNNRIFNSKAIRIHLIPLEIFSAFLTCLYLNNRDRLEYQVRMVLSLQMKLPAKSQVALSNKFQSLNNNSLHSSSSSKIPNSRVKINSNKISITYSLLSSALLIKQLKCLQVIKCLWEIFSIYSMVKLCQAVILLRCLCLTLTMALSKIFSTE